LTMKNIVYHNLRGDQSSDAPIHKKIYRVLCYYWKLLCFARNTDASIFHILWLNKFIYFDRTILNIYYKFLGKRLIHTVHNTNIEQRDGQDSVINRWTLKMMYMNMDHLFVHTEQMKAQLIREYDIKEENITVIPFGINEIIPRTDISKLHARKKLNIQKEDKVALFFGNIAPYKGLEYLIDAISHLQSNEYNIKLLIAGRVKNCDKYWANIKMKISKNEINDSVICRTEYIPDEEVEIYYKASDVVVLPYKNIFQSGVLFLAYSFGVPVIATDVGALKDEIEDGKTGFICTPENAADLANKIAIFFNSDVYEKEDIYREFIINYARNKYSWDAVCNKTISVYETLLSIK
jgi:D-inositol-3-phosphate glycosyltransferase